MNSGQPLSDVRRNRHTRHWPKAWHGLSRIPHQASRAGPFLSSCRCWQSPTAVAVHASRFVLRGHDRPHPVWPRRLRGHGSIGRSRPSAAVCDGPASPVGGTNTTTGHCTSEARIRAPRSCPPAVTNSAPAGAHTTSACAVSYLLAGLQHCAVSRSGLRPSGLRGHPGAGTRAVVAVPTSKGPGHPRGPPVSTIGRRRCSPCRSSTR